MTIGISLLYLGDGLKPSLISRVAGAGAGGREYSFGGGFGEATRDAAELAAVDADVIVLRCRRGVGGGCSIVRRSGLRGSSGFGTMVLKFNPTPVFASDVPCIHITQRDHRNIESRATAARGTTLRIP